MSDFGDGELSTRARAALKAGAEASVVTFFFAAGGASAAKVFAWPCDCLDQLATPEGRAGLSIMMETAFEGWVLNIGGLAFGDKGESRATLSLEPLGRSRDGGSVSIRETLRGGADKEPGFEKVSRLLGQAFGQPPVILTYDFPDCGLRNLDEAVAWNGAISAQEFVEALEAQSCKKALDKSIPDGVAAMAFPPRL